MSNLFGREWKPYDADEMIDRGLIEQKPLEGNDWMERYKIVCEHLEANGKAWLREQRRLEDLIRRAAPFVNAVAVMADNTTPALAWLADAAAAVAVLPTEETE
jgi:hypothetical protein